MDLPSDNNKEDISPREYNNSKRRIKLADIDNNKKDIRLADIGNQKPATPNWIPRNKLPSELSSTFRELRFSESKFLAGISLSDTKYRHSGRQNNNLFYPFNSQLDYTLAHYFADLETPKRNVVKFLTNSLIELIGKNFSYCNVD